MQRLSSLFGAIVALASALVFNGCASVTRGTKDSLVVESTPAGADVRLSTGQTGKTPTSFKLSRKNDLDVYISREGYEPLTVHVSSQISGKGSVGMAGNVLIGGLIGIGVDAVTGAAKDLRPNPIVVTLVPLAAKPAEASKPVETPSQPVVAPAKPAEAPPAPVQDKPKEAPASETVKTPEAPKTPEPEKAPETK